MLSGDVVIATASSIAGSITQFPALRRSKRNWSRSGVIPRRAAIQPVPSSSPKSVGSVAAFDKGEYKQRVRIDMDEKDAFKEAAEIEGIALSAWVRQYLRRAAHNVLEDSHETKSTGQNILDEESRTESVSGASACFSSRQTG